MPAVLSIPVRACTQAPAPISRGLRWLFWGSSVGSAALIAHFYRKSLKGRVRVTACQSERQTSTARKVRVSSAFFSQLRHLLRLLIPSWRSSTAKHLSLITLLLLIRSLCDVWTIYLGTLLESAIITQDSPRFGRLLLQFGATMPAMALVNSLLKYFNEKVQIQFRAELTAALLRYYMSGLTFYKASASNIDQLITTDVDRLTSTLTTLYSQLAKPTLDILIYIWGISSTIGWRVPAYMCGYLGFAAAVLLLLRRPISKLTSREQALEGEFRFCNSRLSTHAEEVAFYGGGGWELRRLLESFAALRKHLNNFAEFKFIVNWAENIIAKYAATVVGYWAVSRPFLAGSTLNALSHQEKLETYYKSGRMLVNLAQAIGRLVINGKDVAKLAGYTRRIHELMGQLQTAEAPTPTLPLLAATATSQEIKEINFNRVPIATPNGDTLLRELTLTLRPGVNVLICGPNGCGKSSLFRILGGLWPLKGGTLTKPRDGALFYVPQRPYMPMGTLRDLIIYPDSVHEMKSKGATDENLVALLKMVGLEWIVGGGGGFKREEDDADADACLGPQRDWDDKDNWMDVLSGGQKQRLAMARLLYHRPLYAILDECTSAISVDVEGDIYTHCKRMGITLITVSHRKSLWAYHDYYLKMDGKGGWEYEEIGEADMID